MIDGSSSPSHGGEFEGVVHARPARARLLGPVAFGVVAALVIGWRNRGEHHLVPDEGLGYALGIAGLGMMVLLLAYSPRKRLRVLRRAGPIQYWFSIHMALGLLGPTAILFHANFQLGSLNANIALACMLVVSASGVVGRFIYTRVHYEYVGRMATLDELRSDARHEGRVLSAAARVAPELGRVLGDFRASCLEPRPTWLGRVAFFLAIGQRARRTRRLARRAWREARAAAEGVPERELQRALREHITAIRRVAEYSAYERAFALWHALHLPFCIVLFLAAAVHVVAVHMY